MPSFSQMKDLYKIQREAKRIKKELKNIHVEAEASGVKVVVNAEQEVISITIAQDVPMDRLPALLIDALNRALKKAQVVAAERMQGVMQQMGLPTGEE
jgi:DNA-binding protein YbaB